MIPLATKVGSTFFMGFLLMMLIYNLIAYFFGRDKSYLRYSGYLLMLVIYTGYLSRDIEDWLGAILFTNHPVYFSFLKLSMYLALMFYLGFIRGFLDLEKLLPKWDIFFKIVIYLGVPFIILDILTLYLTNFSYVVENKVVIAYILLVIIACLSLLYPLYKTKDIY